MFGNPLGNDDDSQRLWNMMVMKMPLTDKEIDEAGPVFAFFFFLIIIVIGVAWILKQFVKP